MSTSMDLWKHLHKTPCVKNISVVTDNSTQNRSNTGMINRFFMMDISQSSINTNNSINFNNNNLAYKQPNKNIYQADRVSISPISSDRIPPKNFRTNRLKDNQKEKNNIKVKSPSSNIKNFIDIKCKTSYGNKAIITKDNTFPKSPSPYSQIQRLSSISKQIAQSKSKDNSPNNIKENNSGVPKLNSAIAMSNFKNESTSITRKKNSCNNYKKISTFTTINNVSTGQKSHTPINKRDNSNSKSNSNSKNIKTRRQISKKAIDVRKTPSPLSISHSNIRRSSPLHSSKIITKVKKIIPISNINDTRNLKPKEKPQSPIMKINPNGLRVKINTSNSTIPMPQIKKKLTISNTIPVKNSMDEQLLENSSRNNIFSPKNGEKPHQSSSTLCSLSLSPKSSHVIKKVSQISHISKTGYAGIGIQKYNQDSFFICNFDEVNYYFIGVCDGHGSNGHYVSTFLKDLLPKIMLNEIKDKIYKIALSKNTNYIHKIIENSFISANSKLSNNANIDTNFSGSTCVSLLISNELLISANVGDSRAIKGTFSLNANKWSYELLTRDHKATEPDEERRIIRFGGRIEQFRENDGTYAGPKRVWLKKEQIPGLAMTRSFGDQIASSVGVICEPEIRDFIWKEEDKFIVIASDGLWEYVSNKEVIHITEKYYNKRDSEGACNILYKTANQKWRDNDNSIDDITIIVIFLE